MKKIIKYIKVKYVTSAIKMAIYKIFRVIEAKGIRYCIEKGVYIHKSKSGKIVFDDKIYLSDNTEIFSDGGIIKIGYNTFINSNCKIISKKEITIGDNCLLGPNVMIYDHDHEFANKEQLICRQGFKEGKVVIGSNVWIGANVVITKGVKIEERVVVGANSVVTSNLLMSGVYAGNPAKFIKEI